MKPLQSPLQGSCWYSFTGRFWPQLAPKHTQLASLSGSRTGIFPHLQNAGGSVTSRAIVVPFGCSLACELQMQASVVFPGTPSLQRSPRAWCREGTDHLPVSSIWLFGKWRQGKEIPPRLWPELWKLTTVPLAHLNAGRDKETSLSSRPYL